jgi:flagellar biosynthesis activator protein FlaF
MAYPAQKYQTTPQPGNPARTEAWALLESARELSHSKTGPTERFLAALRRNWRLWTIFQASLLDPACTLPADVRGNLIGLANFIDKRSAQLLSKPDPALVDALVNINVQIGEGLLAGARAAAQQTPPKPGLRAGAIAETA